MTPERAEVIRDYWRTYAHVAFAVLKKHSVFRCPVYKPLSYKIYDVEPPAPEPMDILEFVLEKGYVENQPHIRVVCEGIEVLKEPV